MNKEELIAILQERKQEALNSDDTVQDTPKQESVHIKKFRNRRREDNSLFKHNLVIFALLITLLYSLYSQFIAEDNVDLTKYVPKEAVTFEDLPKDLKENYILKQQLQEFQAQLREQDKNYISELEKQVETLGEQLSAEQKAKNAVLNKAKSKSKRYNAIGCYDEVEGTKVINQDCKDKISRFLVNNKTDAIKFEIIAVLDVKDKEFINTKVEQVNTAPAIKNSLKEYLTQGLARTRVLEAAWLVKEVLGEKVLISYVNYIAQTESKRGVTIRAYY